MIFVATIGRITFIFDETDLEMSADSHLEPDCPLLLSFPVGAVLLLRGCCRPLVLLLVLLLLLLLLPGFVPWLLTVGPLEAELA